MNQKIGSLLLGIFIAMGMISVACGGNPASNFAVIRSILGSDGITQPEMPSVSEKVLEYESDPTETGVGQPGYFQPSDDEGVCSTQDIFEEGCCEQEGCGSGCGTCGGCNDYCWRAYAGALFWNRTSPGGGVVVNSGGTALPVPLLTGDDYNFDWNNGWQAGIARRLNCLWAIESRFFRIDSFEAASPTIASVDGFSVPYEDPFLAPGLGTLDSTYRSELTNAELNLRRRMTCRIDGVLGFRYLQLNDRYLLDIDTINPTANELHDIHAYNNMYGFHMGADIWLLNQGCFCVQWGTRFGVYGNRIQNGVTIEEENLETTTIYRSRGSDSNVAFSAEMTLAGMVRYNDCLAVRFGYQTLWLEGVAEATSQIALSQPSSEGIGPAGVDTDGSPFYHGAFVDLVLSW